MNSLGKAAAAAAKDLLKRCDQCGVCSKECPLLKARGLPHDHARDALAGKLDPALPFLCSLCGLCTAVCPRKADPAGLYRHLRREYVASGAFDPAPYAGYLDEERRFLSAPHTFFGAPAGARRAFLPGCALSGARPEAAQAVWELLDAREPTAFVLACCGHRSRTVGLADEAARIMDGLAARLKENGIEEVLTPCGSCLAALREAGLETRTVYEVLAEDLPEVETPDDALELAVQDSCSLRDRRPVHEAVRDLVWASGRAVSEMRHAWHKTSCCGAGGAAGIAGPDLPGAWLAQRVEEAADRPVVCACAGCLGTLSARLPAVHVLDLFLGADPLAPPPLYRGREAHARRILLKRRVRAQLRRRGCRA